MKKTYQLWTDGGCEPNPGIGAWAYVLLKHNKLIDKQHSQPIFNTTNNRMEIEAIVQGLASLLEMSITSVEVFSDSAYVINTMTKGWRRRKNQDLWNLMDELIVHFDDIKWTHVKGHSGVHWNEVVDQMAQNVLK